ncbi:MAG: hypothetical protein AAGG51_10725 [Cyanobacteria bacterium P01_G01_bin.54]
MEAVDVKKQAQQGSMAAIIQILNAQLAEHGVRTRALLIDGVLQLLCEANTEAELEPIELVSRVREILEAIELRHLRRVNMFGRIAQEQQMLWLEEMARNPDHSILWTQTITLRRSPFWRRWWPLGTAASNTTTTRAATETSPIDPDVEPDAESDAKAIAMTTLASPTPATPPPIPEFSAFEAPATAAPTPPENPNPPTAHPPPVVPPERNISELRNSLGIVLLCIISFALGQYYHQWRSAQTPVTQTPEASNPESNTAPTPQPTTVVISPTPIASPTVDTLTPATQQAVDAFSAAVRLAEEASLGGQSAQTVQQWQALAKQWQAASELMQAVPDSDERYAIARDRSTTYQQNSEVAKQEAQKRQGLPTPP